MSNKAHEYSLHSRLRSAREASGLSQAQVAKMLQLHRPAVTEIEAGRRKVSAQELETLSKLYGVSGSWLLNGNVKESAEDAKLMIAARQLSDMKQEDLDKLMNMLRMLRNGDDA